MNQVNKIAQDICKDLKNRFPRLWWPGYLFHHTDIQNAISILDCGYLYSRNKVIDLKIIKWDSAGKEVINNSRQNLLNYVRLYFRPLTPPLYHIEGFGAYNNRDSKYNAHCPVPIYLIFDMARVFALSDVQFSACNLASSHTSIFNDAQDLWQLDFTKIYHSGPISGNKQEKNSIVKHRCAEVVVPNALPLNEFLSHIICRSAAERETLLNLMKPSVRRKYENKLCIYGPCFYRHKHFIEETNLRENEISIRFQNLVPGFTYKYIFEFSDKTIVQDYSESIPAFRWSAPRKEYILSVYIDDHIAFKGKYNKIIAPL